VRYLHALRVGILFNSVAKCFLSTSSDLNASANRRSCCVSFCIRNVAALEDREVS
jgi:hypothetical protein